jgi:hypothetical protein
VVDRNGRIGGKRRQFDRIVALLLALADLAERAAGAPRPVRWLVLWALQQADMVAREFVADHSRAVAPRHWSPVVFIVRYGADPADAINLALSLRMLAHAIRTIVAQASRLSLARLGEAIAACGSGGLPGRTAGASLGLLSVAAITRLDTS